MRLGEIMVLLLQSLLQFICKVTMRSESGMGRKIKTVVKILTNHTFCFIFRLLKVLLNKLQVKVEMDMLVLQFSVTSGKLARFLQKTNRQTSKTIHFRVTKEKS